MKKFFFLVCILSVFVFTSACSDDDNSKKIEIEYKIETLDDYVSAITYNGSNGDEVETTDITDFEDGSKKIKISSTPFTAKIAIEVNNTSVHSNQYLLTIYVDGELKEYDYVDVAADAEVTGGIEFIITE
jgi:hypothetical protein